MEKITYKSISNALTNKQMKNILGGSGGGGSFFEGSCGFTGVFSREVPQFGADGIELAFLVIESDRLTACNVSKSFVDYARGLAQSGTFWWCCESCHLSSYCG